MADIGGGGRYIHIWFIWGWWNICWTCAGFKCCMAACALGFPGGMPPMRAAAFICWPGPDTPIWPTSWCGIPPGVAPGWLGLCAIPGAMGWPGGPPGCCCIPPPGCGEKPGPMLAIISRAADYPRSGYRPGVLRSIAYEAGARTGCAVGCCLFAGAGAERAHRRDGRVGVKERQRASKSVRERRIATRESWDSDCDCGADCRQASRVVLR
jgi:hypothetical protein